MRYLVVSYAQQVNGKYNETPSVMSKIKNNTLMTAAVIIDYKERKIVKSRFREKDGSPARDFDTINDFYKQHYGDAISALEAKYEILESVGDVVKEVLAEDITAEDIAEVVKEVLAEDITAEDIAEAVEEAVAEVEAKDGTN